jgi:hypothetical protein
MTPPTRAALPWRRLHSVLDQHRVDPFEQFERPRNRDATGKSWCFGMALTSSSAWLGRTWQDEIYIY